MIMANSANPGGKSHALTDVRNRFRFRFPDTRALQSLISNLLPSRRSRIGIRAKTLRSLVDFSPQSPREVGGAFDAGLIHMTWVIPDFRPGAGGHRTIFQIIRQLELFGHKATLLVQNPSVHKTESAAIQTITEHFYPLDAEVKFFHRELPELNGDAIIATDRFTCFPVQAMSGFRRKFYFVQDYEALFYPMGTEALLAEQTYRMGFDCLCAGEWLADLMREKFDLWASSWPLAYDADIYFMNEATARNNRHIAFYARHSTPRRAVELALMAFNILADRGEKFHVDFFGEDMGDLDADYSFTGHGKLDPAQLGDLYRSASLGMVFSATNHSLANKEMMACGLPVIDLDLESVRAVFSEDCMKMVEPHPVAIADGLQDFLGNGERREQLSQAGLDLTRDLSWEKSARCVESALVERLSLD